MADGAVRVSIDARGYHSHIDIPFGVSPEEALLPWFEMQLSFLKRWQPGTTADSVETRPVRRAANQVPEGAKGGIE